MNEEDDTRISARRDDDPTAASSRADSTRMSRRRLAETATRPALPEDDATAEGRRASAAADTAPAAPPRSEPEQTGLLRPPPGLAVPEARRGDFGTAPQHYYPRLRHTQDAAGAGVWPEPPRHVEQPAVLDEAAREDRREAQLVSRRRRTLALVASGVVAVVAAATVALALL
ncbi:hypothetical protein [Demequina soli]|uniref:hypothetical protein n=1 Tax=Demequina soli TaxID=1638987 RepID=UPI00078398C9|nr:hypothetical protein [Demequina soli]